MENIDFENQELLEPHKCQILGNFGTVIQAVLGLVSFSVLLLKRYFEDPKRPLLIWLLDTSKQAFSWVLAHCMNMMLAILLSNAGESDNWEWYFINISVDVFLGVFLCYLLLKGVENLANRYSFNMLHSGNYLKVNNNRGYLVKETYHQNVKLEDIDLRNWVVQICAWGLIIIIVKLTLFWFQLLTAPILEQISSILVGWLGIYPKIKLILIMVVVPFLLNAFQFWIQDNILKQKKPRERHETEMSLIQNCSRQAKRSMTFDQKDNFNSNFQLNNSRRTNGSVSPRV